MNDASPSISVLLIRTFCPLLLLLIMAINGVGLIAGWRLKVDFNENRNLADFPKWDGSLPHYLRAFDSFVKDNFPFRKPLLLGFNSALYYGFRSTTQPKVIIGRGDWIFGVEYDSSEGKFEPRQLSPEYLQKLRISLEERRDWLAEQGIGFYFMFYPTKTTIYGEKYFPEYIPFDFRQPSPTAQIVETLGPVIKENFVPMEQTLREAAVYSDSLYYLTDTHATHEGTFLAIENLWAKMRSQHASVDIAPYPDFEFKDDSLYPTAYGRIMGIPFKDMSQVRVPLGGFNAKITDLPPSLSSLASDYQRKAYSKNPLLTKSRLLVLGDSFTNRMNAYLAESFAEVLTVNLNHSPNTPEGKFPTALIQAFKPDVVVMAYLEARLQDSPTGIDANIVPLLNPHQVRQSRLRRIFAISQEPAFPLQITHSHSADQFTDLKISSDIPASAQTELLLEIEYRGEKPITLSRAELPGTLAAESRELTLELGLQRGFIFLPRDPIGQLVALKVAQPEFDPSLLSIKGKWLKPTAP